MAITRCVAIPRRVKLEGEAMSNESQGCWLSNTLLMEFFIKLAPSIQAIYGHWQLPDYSNNQMHSPNCCHELSMGEQRSDEEERQIQQAASKCGWGEDIPHLGNAWLEKKQNTTMAYTSGRQHGSSNSDNGRTTKRREEMKKLAGKDKPDQKNNDNCWLFNLNRCFWGDSCRYKHVCESCGGNHAAVDRVCSPVPSKNN